PCDATELRRLPRAGHGVVVERVGGAGVEALRLLLIVDRAREAPRVDDSELVPERLELVAVRDGVAAVGRRLRRDARPDVTERAAQRRQLLAREAAARIVAEVQRAVAREVEDGVGNAAEARAEAEQVGPRPGVREMVLEGGVVRVALRERVRERPGAGE